MLGFCGLFVVAGVSRAIAEERRGEHSLPTDLAWAEPIMAMVLAVGNLATAGGMNVTHAPQWCITLSIYLTESTESYCSV